MEPGNHLRLPPVWVEPVEPPNKPLEPGRDPPPRRRPRSSPASAPSEPPKGRPVARDDDSLLDEAARLVAAGEINREDYFEIWKQVIDDRRRDVAPTPDQRCGHPWKEGQRSWVDGRPTSTLVCRVCGGASESEAFGEIPLVERTGARDPLIYPEGPRPSSESDEP